MLHDTQELVCSVLLNHCSKVNQLSEIFLEFFSLTFFVRIILLHLNNVHLLFNCTPTKNTKTYLQLLTKLPKMTKIVRFLFLYLPNLLFRCGDIKAYPCPKYSSLTFCY